MGALRACRTTSVAAPGMPSSRRGSRAFGDDATVRRHHHVGCDAVQHRMTMPVVVARLLETADRRVAGLGQDAMRIARRRFVDLLAEVTSRNADHVGSWRLAGR